MKNKMLLCKQLILSLDKSNEVNELTDFKYKLIIHNHNEEQALISLILQRHINCFSQNLKVIEYEQVDIPKNLTMKDWLIKMVLEKDPLLNKMENLHSKREKEAVIKIKENFERRMSQLKIKIF